MNYLHQKGAKVALVTPENKFQSIKKYLLDGGMLMIAGLDYKGRIAEGFISCAVRQKQVVDLLVKQELRKIPKIIRWIWKIN